MINRWIYLLIPFFLLFLSCENQSPDSPTFQSTWSERPNLVRPFAGGEYWLNPLQAWRQQNGRLEVTTSGGDRNCVLLTHYLNEQIEDFDASVMLERLDSTNSADPGWAGFQIGLQGEFGDYRDDAVHGRGFCAGITNDGRLFIGQVDSADQAVVEKVDQGRLRLSFSPVADGASYLAVLTYTVEGRDFSTEKNIHPSWLAGLLALTCSQALPERVDLPALRPAFSDLPNLPKGTGGNTRYAFSDWQISGDKLSFAPDRSYGPILWTQYTLSDNILKLSAQFAPLGNDVREAELRVAGQTIARASIATDGNNAIFRLNGWDSTRDQGFDIHYTDRMGQLYSYSGTIVANEPGERLRVASLSCVDDVGFPHQDLVDNVAAHHPDLYIFHGDQLYERVGGYGVERQSKLDYLRKWYIFGWSFGPLLRDRPAVIIPDDHDVFHGNLWGEGGKLANIELGYGYDSQDDGGYKERPDFVNMVHRTQTGHLPDPFDPTPVLNDISVYYTILNYKGVSFAILGDRQWKSAPKRMFPEAEIENGWPQNTTWDPKTQAYHPEAELLGPRQEAFLEQWAGNWSPQVYMKAVISQSPFCNVATLPKDIYHDKYVPGLPKYRPGDYPPDDRPVADFDANGWPQNKRDQALRSMRKAFALHLTGDQHLGSTGQYGIDSHGDAGYWISCPAVSNLWPRRWYPAAYGLDGKPADAPRYTGKYEDGFGNKITVKAIANPYDIDREPAKIFDKAPGYSIIDFDISGRAMDLAVWPRWSGPDQPVDNQPFPDWPLRISQEDNYGRERAGYLPAVEVSGEDLVRVFPEKSDELLYALKPAGETFRPFVFDRSLSYRVEVIAPDGQVSTRSDQWIE